MLFLDFTGLVCSFKNHPKPEQPSRSSRRRCRLLPSGGRAQPQNLGPDLRRGAQDGSRVGQNHSCSLKPGLVEVIWWTKDACFDVQRLQTGAH